LYKIAISGGSGYVGTALCSALSNEFEVQILDRKMGNAAVGNFLECDVRQYDEVEKGISGCDLLIHAAIVQIPKINQDTKLGYEVNILGTHNVCKAVKSSRRCKGLILVSSWHTMGERGITGTVDEKFGMRPDMVEERARAYALSKMGQEAIVRLHDENSRDKVFGLVRIGTALGENMPSMTAANLFINAALEGKPMTPYEHSMYRPMLFADILDVSRAFRSYASKILAGSITATGNSLDHITNVYYPEPITILELAEIIRDSVIDLSNGKIRPRIEVVKKEALSIFGPESKGAIRVDLAKSRELLGLQDLTHPKDALKRIISARIRQKTPNGK
jgi:UDP-glucose 4-epimerase